MGNGYRDDDDGGADTEQPDAYWRRRVITLALGLGLLGILAWGFSGGGAKTAQSGHGSALPATALGTAIPGLGGSSATAPASSASPSASGASPSPSPSPSTAASAAAHASAQPQPSANHVVSPLTAGQGRCGPGSVVLSLFTDRSSYGPSQLPQFQVFAVSTTSASCSFDPAQLQVQVMSSGRIVWDSADCARAAGRRVQLTRGVPAQASVTWDRAVTLPGCQVLATARAGSYTVQARTVLAGPAVPAGTVQSPVRTFRLSG